MSGSEPPLVGDFDIPPAIACAHCGKASCDGCAPDSARSEWPSAPAQQSEHPWERTSPGMLERLVLTSEISATNPQWMFGTLRSGSIAAALQFAVLCELLAVASFTLVWAVSFWLLLHFVAREMLTSPPILLLVGVILLGLSAFVVVVHAIWGIGLEWGIARAGGRADMNRGIRFGLYACGWDLLTSPAGLWFQWRRSGFRLGTSHVWAGTKAPRPSLRAYLDTCRHTSEREHKSAVWTAIWLGLAGVTACGALLFVGLLLVWMPWVF